MRRNPTLEIKRADLEQILSRHELFSDTQERDTFIQYLFENARPFIDTKRQILCTYRKKLVTDVREALSINDYRIDHFVSLLNRIRHVQTFGKNKLQHKRNSQYRVLQKVSELAYTYANEFYPNDLDAGLCEYIKVCISWMANGYGLNRFDVYTDRIMEYGRRITEIRKDANPTLTRKCCDVYEKRISQLSGYYYNRSDDLEYYYNFVMVRKCCDEHRTSPENWLQAQFEAYPNSYPEPYQLYTDAARGNYIKYTVRKRAQGITTNESEFKQFVNPLIGDTSEDI